MLQPIIQNYQAINKTFIAKKVGLSPQYVNSLLRGKRKNKKSLQKVLDAIKKTIDVTTK